MGLMLSCSTCCGVGFGRRGSLTSSTPCWKPGAEQRQSRSIHVTPKSELGPLFVGQILSNSWCWETSLAKRGLALTMMPQECWRCSVLTPSHQSFLRDRKVLLLHRDSEGSSTSESSYPVFARVTQAFKGESRILLFPTQHFIHRRSLWRFEVIVRHQLRGLDTDDLLMGNLFNINTFLGWSFGPFPQRLG